MKFRYIHFLKTCFLVLLGLLAIVAIISILLANQKPIWGCGTSNYVGSCDFWGRFKEDFVAGSALVVYFWALATIIMTMGMTIGFLFKKAKHKR